VHTDFLGKADHPNLYLLRTQLLANGKVIDEKITTVGFKTFEARGNRLYLNGKPYFLRGADMPPHGLAPNDKALADKFMKMMHDGNTMATRFHVSPPSKIWMDACDKYGVGASVGENWPWVLMGDTPIPDPKLIQAWKDEWREIVRANRNHPSLMIWTISNESYFEGGRDKDKARSVEKFRIFSDVIKSARALDPDAMVVFHSGYVRSEADYRDVLKPNGLDDGDIDDSHHYWGWYNRSPFHLDVAKDVEKRRFEGRPLISQEASTGYPDQDTGHPTESYIINHSVPQSWVGQYGLYTARPDMFLETHAQITKEYAEKIRRDRNYLSGWMIFANCCWFRDVYDPDRIAPYPVYGEVKKAYEPVLVSLANPNRHFEAGRTFDGDVYVVNDDPDRPKLTNLTLRWRIFGKSFDPGASGVVSVPDCPYDGKTKAAVEFRVPTNLPLDRSNMTLALELRQGDDVISRNDYPLICASPKWYETANQRMIVVETGTETNEYHGNRMDGRSRRISGRRGHLGQVRARLHGRISGLRAPRGTSPHALSDSRSDSRAPGGCEDHQRRRGVRGRARSCAPRRHGSDGHALVERRAERRAASLREFIPVPGCVGDHEARSAYPAARLHQAAGSDR
jgi:beta-galactosidase